MPRLFIAIELSDEIKDHIGEVQMGIREANWTKRSQLHLTLKFIGEVDPRQAAAIQAALGKVTGEPFTLRLNALGQFPPKGKARILMAAVEENAALEALHGRVEDALAEVGVEREGRRFVPHITVARFKAPPTFNLLGRYFDTNKTFVTKPSPVNEIVLYSSKLTPGGPIHTREQVYPLKQG